MKVLFIYSVYGINSTQQPLSSWSPLQFGISYISAVLKKYGHTVKLLVLGSANSWSANNQLIMSYVDDCNPRLICFTSVYSEYTFIEKIAGFIKSQWPDKYLIIGGVHSTLNPSDVIQGPFDALCIGEGEYPLLELCSQLEEKIIPHGIANLWIKSGHGAIEKNMPRDFIQDLNSLPFPDREMWRPLIKDIDSGFTVMLGRGCPHNCTYCCNHALKKVAAGKYVRFRSPENIIEEVTWLYKTFPKIKSIYFEVESIALNKAWLFELCRQLDIFNSTINNGISYGCNYRISPQSIDEEIFIALHRANFNQINIGLESGSERVRKEVLKRHYSNKDFLNVVFLARKHGLKVYTYNMIGLPEETIEDHLETVSLNRQCQPDFHYTSIFVPYPGTELFNKCIKAGLIKGPIDLRMERSKAIIEFPKFPKAQIQKAFTLFDYRVFKGYKPLWKIIFRIISIKITGNIFYRKLSVLPFFSYLRAKLRLHK